MSQDLAEAVERLCRQHHLLWHRCDHAAGTGPAGGPDIWVIGRGGVLLVRLHGPVQPAEPDWGKTVPWLLYRNETVSWAVWTPADLASGRVEAELERLRWGRRKKAPPKAKKKTTATAD